MTETVMMTESLRFRIIRHLQMSFLHSMYVMMEYITRQMKKSLQKFTALLP